MRLQNAIGWILRTGVMLAAGVVAVGGIAYLAAHGGDPAGFHLFRGEPAPLRSVGGIVSGLARGDSRGIIQFGLLILIATPIARVLFSLASFAAERDRTYVVVTTVVLAVLLYSLAVGH